MANQPTTAVARDHCLAPGRGDDALAGHGRYSRMFPQLDPLVDQVDLLRALGRAGGVCDVADAGRSSTVDAGWPVFGQYLAHDITADRSSVTHHDDLELIRNARSARANLECLYGQGPTAEPYLFDSSDNAAMLLDDGDLPRNRQGIALIGDPRQDSHVLMSQFHVAMIKAHNRLVRRLRQDGTSERELFAAARESLMWHYQYVILHDFLPVMIGADRTAALIGAVDPAAERAVASIPLEFADAAYRFGHSQMRSSYQLQPDGPQRRLFPDLLGFQPVGDRTVDWTVLLTVGGQRPPQQSRPIDGRMSDVLLHLPEPITGPIDNPDDASLAVRDLLRGLDTALPSGEFVAAELGLTPLDAADVGLAAQGRQGQTPLWFYLLREADVFEQGERLGPVGAHIVGTTLVDIIAADPESYLSVEPTWTPTLPARKPGQFTLADLIIAF